MTEAQRKRLSPLGIVLILSGVFFAVFMIISAALFFGRSSTDTGPKTTGSAFFGGQGVAIIEVNGVIMDSKKTVQKLERAEEDPRIKAVVVRLNSPGGSVGPSQEVYEAVRRLKKPVVASMGGVAASGAFYIAMGSKKIFANPGTITGSIGVIMEFANLEKLYEWAKVKRYSLRTGKYKGAGAEYREMTAEEKELLQGMLDDVLKQFKQAVATGRKLPLAQVDAVADGRTLTGNQAKALKLVDELGTLQDAIEEAGKMGGIKGKPKVIYLEAPKRRIWDFLLETAPEDEDAEAFSGGSNLFSLIRYALGRIASGATSPAWEDRRISPGVYWLWNAAR